MKTIKLFIMMLLAAFSEINANTILIDAPDEMGCYVEMSPCTLRFRFCYVVTGWIGKGSPCKELSLACIKVDQCERAANTDLKDVSSDKSKLIFERTGNNEISISYLASEVTSDYFLVEKNYTLPSLISNELGERSIAIVAGKYLSVKDPAGFWTTRFKIAF